MSDIDKYVTISKLASQVLVASHFHAESSEVPAKLTIVPRGRSLLVGPKSHLEQEGNPCAAVHFDAKVSGLVSVEERRVLLESTLKSLPGNQR